MSLILDEKTSALLDYLRARPDSERNTPFPCVECGQLVCVHCGMTIEPSNLPEKHWPGMLGGPLLGKVPKGYCTTCGALLKKKKRQR